MKKVFSINILNSLDSSVWKCFEARIGRSARYCTSQRKKSLSHVLVEAFSAVLTRRRHTETTDIITFFSTASFIEPVLLSLVSDSWSYENYRVHQWLRHEKMLHRSGWTEKLVLPRHWLCFSSVAFLIIIVCRLKLMTSTTSCIHNKWRIWIGHVQI